MAHEDEFAVLVRTHGRALLRLAAATCGDLHRGEDVLQGALERAYVRRRRVMAADRPAAYLTTIVYRACLSDLRRPVWRRERSVASVDDTTADVAAAGDEHGDLIDALRGLPPKQRAAVVLRYLEDLSVQDTALALGVSEGTVKSQCHEGIKKLRGSLLNSGATT